MMPSNRNTTHYVTSLCYELCRDVEGRQGDSCIYVIAVHHEVMTVYTHTHTTWKYMSLQWYHTGPTRTVAGPHLFSSHKFQMLVEITESEDDMTQVEESCTYLLLLISADQYIVGWFSARHNDLRGLIDGLQQFPTQW